MNRSRAWFEAVARETGYRVDTLEKVTRLGELAAEVVGVAELASGKLLASLDRAAPRDLFDVARLPSVVGDSWGTPRMRSLFVALAGMLTHPVHSYRPDRWSRVTDRVVAEQLHPMLMKSARPKAVDLRDAAWAVVDPLLDLTPAERAYTDRIQAGELRPDLLFGDDQDLAARVARHPALLWKSENASRHQKGRA